MCVCVRARVRVHTCARECVLDSDQTCNLELICQLNFTISTGAEAAATCSACEAGKFGTGSESG
jgi:hypothetical protein